MEAISLSTILANQLQAANIPVTGTTDGPPVSYQLSSEATPEQREMAEVILANLPSISSSIKNRNEAYTQAELFGCPVTIGDRTVVFAASLKDYGLILADLSGMVALNNLGYPDDIPEFLMNKNEKIERFETRSEAINFITQYRAIIKAQWSVLWDQQQKETHE